MWITYLIPILYITTVLAPYGYNYFNLFLKSLTNPDGTPRWTTEQVNAIPIAGGAINVVFGTPPPSIFLKSLLTARHSLDMGHIVRRISDEVDPPRSPR